MASRRSNRYKHGMNSPEKITHTRLKCGIELAGVPIPGRATATFELRFLAGVASEPPSHLGLAKLVEETIDKGTEQRSGQGLSDAFDAIGAQRGSAAGRESFLFRCSCLPEFVERALDLHVEFLTRPTFPDDACQTAVALAQQELTALEDEPDDLARKFLAAHAYGDPLGRHPLGTRESIASIGRNEIVAFWNRWFSTARMQVVIGGAVDIHRVAAQLDKAFDGFGVHGETGDGRTPFPISFDAGQHHYAKELEQEYLMVCWPGLEATHRDQPIEQLVVAILGGGMSARLFTEVREKQGLVYWVGAWEEHPRGGGRVCLGASTTPARCDQTYSTLLREVDRLAEDLTQEELVRAKTGIIARRQTHGDITRARVGRAGNDLFIYGRPVPREEKDAQVAAVTIDDIHRYLRDYPRDERCLVTLGPRAIGEEC